MPGPSVGYANLHFIAVGLADRSGSFRRFPGPRGRFGTAPKSHGQLRRIGLDFERAGMARADQGRFLRFGVRLEFGDYIVNDFGRVRSAQERVAGAGQEHHVGDHLVDPHRLRVYQRQRLAAARDRSRAQRELRPAGDDGQRVVDFVARPGGEFGHSLEFFGFEGCLELVFQRIEPRQESCQLGFVHIRVSGKELIQESQLDYWQRNNNCWQSRRYVALSRRQRVTCGDKL